MTKKNPRLGSSFESWLDAQGLREEVQAAAVKQIIADERRLGSGPQRSNSAFGSTLSSISIPRNFRPAADNEFKASCPKSSTKS